MNYRNHIYDCWVLFKEDLEKIPGVEEMVKENIKILQNWKDVADATIYSLWQGWITNCILDYSKSKKFDWKVE